MFPKTGLFSAIISLSLSLTLLLSCGGGGGSRSSPASDINNEGAGADIDDSSGSTVEDPIDEAGWEPRDTVPDAVPDSNEGGTSAEPASPVTPPVVENPDDTGTTSPDSGTTDGGEVPPVDNGGTSGDDVQTDGDDGTPADDGTDTADDGLENDMKTCLVPPGEPLEVTPQPVDDIWERETIDNATGGKYAAGINPVTDMPNVVYMDMSHSSTGELKFASRDEITGLWIQESVGASGACAFSLRSSENIGMAFQDDGTPHVITKTYTNSNPSTSMPVHFLKFNDKWELRTIGTTSQSNATIFWNGVSIDRNGNPVFMYSLDSYIKYNYWHNSSWKEEKVETVSMGYRPYSFDLKTIPGEGASAVMGLGEYGQLTLKTRGDSLWTTILMGDDGTGVSMEVNGQNNTYISYCPIYSDPEKKQFLTIKKKNQGEQTFTPVTLPEIPCNGDSQTSLAVGPDNNIHMLHILIDGTGQYYQQNGPEWINSSLNMLKFSTYPKLLINKKGSTWIVYYMNEGDSWRLYALKKK